MTLEEAIRQLQNSKIIGFSIPYHIRMEAIQLGIEALAFIKAARPDPNFGHIPLLPHETEE